MTYKDKLLIFLLITISCLLFFWKISNMPLIDGDTAYYATLAKNMVISGDWITLKHTKPGEIINKPPLFIWIIAISYKIFGINELAIRLPHAFLTILLVILTYLFGSYIYNKRIGFLSAIILLTSVQFFYQGRSPLQDIPLVFFISIGLILFFLFEDKQKAGFLYIASASFALAVMTKGPVGIVLPFIIIFFYILFSKSYKSYTKTNLTIHLPLGIIIFLIITVPWFLIETILLGPKFINVFISDNLGRYFSPIDVIGRQEFKTQFNFYHYALTLPLLTIPWGGFIYPSIFYHFKKVIREKKSSILLLSWVLSTLIFFSLSGNYKIERYILPLFPALSIMLALYVDTFLQHGKYFSFKGIILVKIIYVILTLIVFLLIFKFGISNTRIEYIAYKPIILPALFILECGLLFGTLFLFFDKNKRAIITFIVFSLVAYIVLINQAEKYLCIANPVKNYAQIINKNIKRGGIKVLQYKGFENHFLIFYSENKVNYIGEDKEIQKLIDKNIRFYGIGESISDLENLKMKFKGHIKIIIENYNNFLFKSVY